MSTVTQNLGLIKDDENDFYDVNRVNDNLDKIDDFASNIKNVNLVAHTQSECIKSLPDHSMESPIVDLILEGKTYDNLCTNLKDFQGVNGSSLVTIVNDNEIKISSSSASTTYISDIFAVHPNTEYTILGEIYNESNGTCLLVFRQYDINKTSLGNSVTSSSMFGSLSTYANTAYMSVLCTVNADATTGNVTFKNIGVLLGALTRDDIPIGTDIYHGLDSVKNLHITTIGQNWFDNYNEPDDYNPNKEDVLVTPTKTGIRVKTLSEGQSRNVEYKVKLKGDTKYTITRSLNKISGATSPSAGEIYISGIVDSPYYSPSMENHTFTTLSDGVVNLRFYATRGIVEEGDIEFNDIMLVEGDNPVSYEVYKSSQLSIRETFREVYGEKDKIEWVNGDYILTRRIKEYELQAQDITLLSKQTNIAILFVSKPPDSSSHNKDQDIIEITKTYAVEGLIPSTFSDNLNRIGTFFSVSSGSRLGIVIKKDEYQDLAAARVAFVGTKIQYVLAEPEIINLTEEMKVWGSLHSYRDGNLYQFCQGFTGNITCYVATNEAATINNNVKILNTQEKQIATNTEMVKNIPDLINSTEEAYIGSHVNGTYNLDLSEANIYILNLIRSSGINFINVAEIGKFQSCIICITQGAIAYSVTFGNSIKWDNDEIPDMTEVNKVYTLTFYTIDGGTTFVGQLINTHSA